MERRNKTYLTLLVVGTACLALQAIPRLDQLGPRSPQETYEVLSGGRSMEVFLGWSGCGWSLEPDTYRAGQEALDQARGGRPAAPTLTLAFYNPVHDPEELGSALRRGGAQRILGETTHEGILTPDGYKASDQGVLGLMASHLTHVEVGVGGASFDEGGVVEATRLAFERARRDAALREPLRTPSAVILCVTLPHEEAVLAELANLTGPDVPLVGGTAAGTVDALQRKKISNWSILANERVIRSGLGLALIYSEDDFLWSYGGGYERMEAHGEVTQVTGRLIHTIDGQPAEEVYDNWLQGGVTAARKRGDDIVNYCTLYPISRAHAGDRNQFIRAWPADDPEHPGSLRTGSSVQVGDRIYLAKSTREDLLGYFSSVPGEARKPSGDRMPTAGLFIYCGGALACIPGESRLQMANLVGDSMGDLPWIGVFTWGEQGNLPGVGNLHSNLSSAALLFPPPSGKL